MGDPVPEDPTFELLKTSYGEVLDATKHQDEKIGRILAAVSFLAAAAIALVNANGIGLFRQFTLGGHRLPLLAYAFVAFVVGVVFSVTLLLSSVTTSLTLPGRPGGGRGEDSMIYFYSISGRSLQRWCDDWSDTATLRDRFAENFKTETYNLAVRTNHKYRRTSEAVAMLRFTLFSLGVAVVLAGAVVTAPPVVLQQNEPPPPVAVGNGVRIALAAFVAAYTFVVVLVARRDLRVDLRVRGLNDERRWWQRGFLGLQVLPPVLAGLLLASEFDAAHRALLPVAVSTAILLTAAALPDEGKWRQRLRAVAPRLVIVVVLLGVVSASWRQSDEAWRWLAALIVPTGFTTLDLYVVESKIHSMLKVPSPRP